MSLNTFEFLAGQSAAALRRNPLVAIAAVTNVAVALSILGAFFLAALNLHHMAALEAQAAVITCELSGDRPAADVERDLLVDLRVKDTKFIPKGQALGQLAEKWKFDLETLKLMGNPLPDSILVYVNDPDEIKQVCTDIARIAGIAQTRYPEQITEKILIVARGVKIAGLAIGVVLILATLTVISTTIRLTIYARRREIRIMQLVGATRWFIRLPFLLEGLFHGVVGGLVGTTAITLGYLYLEGYVSNNLGFISLVTSTQFLVVFSVCMVLVGAIFGALGSLTGVRRYLRAV